MIKIGITVILLWLNIIVLLTLITNKKFDLFVPDQLHYGQRIHHTIEAGLNSSKGDVAVEKYKIPVLKSPHEDRFRFMAQVQMDANSSNSLHANKSAGIKPMIATLMTSKTQSSHAVDLNGPGLLTSESITLCWMAKMLFYVSHGLVFGTCVCMCVCACVRICVCGIHNKLLGDACSMNTTTCTVVHSRNI